MTGYPGPETAEIIANYPVETMRDFGVKVGAESLPSLTPHRTGKLSVMPLTCRPHVSWKQWDESRQRTWLDTMPRDNYYREFDSSYWHEPMGDIAPSTYRDRAVKWLEMLATHPNGNRVQTGPIVTRYWLVEKKGNPLDWWYDGADFYGVDIYEDLPNRTDVVPSADLFGPALDKIYAAIPDNVDIVIPEYGRKHGVGIARATALAADIKYLRENHPRVRAIDYFNLKAYPEFYFSPDSPEGKVWETV